jgi:hypothetical protein
MKKRYAGLLSLVLCGTLCTLPLVSSAQVPPPPPPGEAPAMAQVRAGDAFMQSGQYREAAAQYEAAYAIDPDIAILERLAQAYRASGDLPRAAAIDQRIAAQRGGYAPPPPPTYVAPSPPPYYVPASPVPVYTYTRPRSRPGQQLLNSGIGLLVAGYAIGIAGGAITMAATYSTNADPSWYGAGGMLFIPIAGPFATMAYNSNYWWAVPWAVIDGGMQLTGLALTIAGAAIRASHPHRPTADLKLPFTLSPYSTANGGGLVFRTTF